MDISKEFERYMAHLAQGLGHADRHTGLAAYCTGLMLPLSRKSVEPMVVRVDPLHASARHQSLHHFVAKGQWSNEQMLRLMAQLSNIDRPTMRRLARSITAARHGQPSPVGT